VKAKLPDPRYEDAGAYIRVEVNWVQTLSLERDSRFFFDFWP
jgi:hypothetical protein